MSETQLEPKWDELSDGIESFWPEDFQVTDETVMSSSVSFEDRLAELCLSGFLPLTLLSVLCLLLATQHHWALSAFSALVLGPLVAFFVRPFVCRVGTVVETRVLVLALPIFLLCVVLSVLPGAALKKLQGDFIHSGMIVVLLQEHLEQAFSLFSVSLFVLLCVAVALVVSWFKKRVPWCEPTPTTKWAILWRLCLIAFLFGWGTWSMQNYRPLTDSEEKWVSEVRASFEDQPYFELPDRTEETFWADRFKRFDDVRTRLFPERDRDSSYSKEEIARIANAVGLHLDLDAHPPKTESEYNSCDAYYFRHLAASPNPDPSLHLLLIKLHVQSRPTGDSIYTEDRFPEILRSLETRPASSSQLEQWREDVVDLRSVLFTRAKELDCEVYRLLFSLDSQVDPDRTIGWQSAKEIYSWQEKPKMNWVYRGEAPTAGIKLLGWTFEKSPTSVFAAAQNRYLLRRWLKIREMTLNSPLSDQVAIFGTERDGLGEVGTTEYRFWDQLAKENNVVNELRSLQTAELILSLRLFQDREGRYPESFEELELDWLAEGRYELLKDEDSLKLKDSALKESFSFPLGER